MKNLIPFTDDYWYEEHNEQAQALNPEQALHQLQYVVENPHYGGHELADFILLGLVERFVPHGKTIAEQWLAVDKMYE